MRRIGLLLTVLAALAGCGENAATAPAPTPAPWPPPRRAPGRSRRELAPAVGMIERGRFDAARAAADAYLAGGPATRTGSS